MKKDNRTDRAWLERVTKIIEEAREAEVEGKAAVASLLALQVLKLQPDQPEARAIFDRTQARLRQTRAEEPKAIAQAGTSVPGPALPADFPLRAEATSASGIRSWLKSRWVRRIGPALSVAVLLAIGVWVWQRWEQEHSSEVVAGASGSSQEAEVPVPPGTVGLNIIPWGRVESIVDLTDGRELEHAEVISPAIVSLPPGRYLFTVSHPDFGSQQFPVEVASGRQIDVHHSLLSDRELESELSGGAR
jgi:hypothetical protein